MKQLTDLPQIGGGFANTISSYSCGDVTTPLHHYQPYQNPGLTVGGLNPSYTFYEPAVSQILYNQLIRDEPKKEKKKMSEMRVVQVFILDPDKNVPLEKRLLYTGEPKFTDMTDQDLFFDLDIKEILKAHNEYRVTLLNKCKSNATEKVLLEPVRASQLKMVVATQAQF